MRAFLQGPKPELLHHQKFFENGTAERAKESGTEQNYNMIDGCVNNVPKKPRRIGGRWSVLDKERLDSLDEKAEVFLTMLASFAQEESRSISTNIKWATRSRMKAGTQKVGTTSLLGYDTDDNGEIYNIQDRFKMQ